MILQYENHASSTVAEFVCGSNLSPKYGTFLRKWLRAKDTIFSNASNKMTQRLLRKPTIRKARWKKMEDSLYKDIRERRARKARVSAVFIRTRAKYWMHQEYPGDAASFKASRGWLMRFKRRKGLKFWKRQNHKRINMEEKREAVSQYTCCCWLLVFLYD